MKEQLCKHGNKAKKLSSKETTGKLGKKDDEAGSDKTSHELICEKKTCLHTSIWGTSLLQWAWNKSTDSKNKTCRVVHICHMLFSIRIVSIRNFSNRT